MTIRRAVSIALICTTAALAAAPMIAQRGTQTTSAIDDRTRRVVGCYALALGKWAAGRDTNARPEYPPPARFHLDSLGRSGFPATYFQVSPSSGTGALNIDAWHWTDSTRLAITWSANTLSGMQLDLRVVGDSLVGDASAFGELDVISRTFPSATVVARRTPCLAP